MYNGKTAITSALTADALLIAIVPASRISDGIRASKEPVYPYITFEEIDNRPGLFADEDEVESEVTFRIHIWGTSSVSVISGYVDRIMNTIEYVRNYSRDEDEQLDSGVIIKHKIMSYTGNFTA